MPPPSKQSGPRDQDGILAVHNETRELSDELSRTIDRVHERWVREVKAIRTVEEAQRLDSDTRSALEEAQGAIARKLGIRDELAALAEIQRERAAANAKATDASRRALEGDE